MFSVAFWILLHKPSDESRRKEVPSAGMQMGPRKNYDICHYCIRRETEEIVTGHFGTKTFRYQDTSAPNYGAEVSVKRRNNLYCTRSEFTIKPHKSKITYLYSYANCCIIRYRELKEKLCLLKYRSNREMTRIVKLLSHNVHGITCTQVIVAHTALHYWAVSTNSRQSSTYLDCCFLGRSVSRRNYGRKVALHRPRLSHIIEFTRRRHICMRTTIDRRGSREARNDAVDRRAWFFCRRSSRRALKWRRNMSNRATFRRVNICIGIEARRSLPRVEWVHCISCIHAGLK